MPQPEPRYLVMIHFNPSDVYAFTAVEVESRDAAQNLVAEIEFQHDAYRAYDNYDDDTADTAEPPPAYVPEEFGFHDMGLWGNWEDYDHWAIYQLVVEETHDAALGG